MKSLIEAQVDHLFRNAPDRSWEVRRNPVTGARWVRGDDPIGPQKRDACRALRARAWFAQNGPQDVQPLPLSYAEREDLKSGGSALQRIVACFGGSLEARNYAYDEHPSFDDFAGGVLASPDAWFITEDQELAKRYPPRALPGLGSGLYWEPGCVTFLKPQPLVTQRAILNGPAPAPLQSEQDLVDRSDANIPDWFPAWACRFLLLKHDFIAHATKCAAYKRLPRGWRVDKPGDVFSRVLGDHKLWVIGADHGWLIERRHLLDDDREHDQILAHFLLEAPVLCPTYVLAARLAEAAYPHPAEDWQMSWHGY